MYALKTFLVQSLAAIVIVVALYVYYSIKESHYVLMMNSPTTVSLGDTKDYMFFVWLVVEFIFIPINTIYLGLISLIPYNRIKIKTNISIVLFLIITIAMYFVIMKNEIHITKLCEYIYNMFGESYTHSTISNWAKYIIEYSIISIVLFIMNVFVYIHKKQFGGRAYNENINSIKK